jgi:3-methyladenine DNA glycosylase AlkD
VDQASELAREIREYCAAHENPKLAGKWARYFKEGYDSWGLLDRDNPIWHGQQQQWLDKYRKMGLRGFLKLGAILFESPKYEEGSLAIRFLKEFRGQVDAKALPAIGKWYQAGIRNWAHDDVLCGEVLTPALVAGQFQLEDLSLWRESALKYQRRAVPVTMLGLVKARQEPASLIEFLRPMMMDPERVVHQGLGWFLREVWKKQPKPVEKFLLQWKDSAPRLIFQYAT